MRKKTKSDRSDIGQLMQMIQLSVNEKEMQFLIGGDPMVRFIKRKDLPRYVKEGYNIPYIGHLFSIDDVKEAMKFASSISATGGVTLLMMDNSLVTFTNSISLGSREISEIKDLIAQSKAGDEMMAIITNPPGKISIPKTLGTDENSQEGTAPANHQFLKEPLNDEMLMEALKTAATAMLNDEHTAHMKWKDSDGYHEKEYGVNHLLVSLFYYIYVNGLNSSSSFFWRQRTQFHEYCSRNMPQGLSICTDRYFRNCISNLVLKSCSFDKYIKMNPKPEVEWEKGKFNMEFWYAVYCEAERYFELILPKTTQE